MILAHYRGSRKDWDHKWCAAASIRVSRALARYKQHVRHSLSGVGYKFHFLQPPKEAPLACSLRRAYKAGDWEKRYDYIWALDSDIDISQSDLLQFLKAAKEIGASIVGPTFALWP